MQVNPEYVAQESVKPSWNSQLAELRLGDRLIKQFRQPAKLQRLILSCFQEDNWTRRIDDPLPPSAGGDGNPMEPKKRLRDLVASLNASHVTPGLLRFRSDGTGEGIVWDWLNSSHVTSPGEAPSLLSQLRRSTLRRISSR